MDKALLANTSVPIKERRWPSRGLLEVCKQWQGSEIRRPTHLVSAICVGHDLQKLDCLHKSSVRDIDRRLTLVLQVVSNTDKEVHYRFGQICCLPSRTWSSSVAREVMSVHHTVQCLHHMGSFLKWQQFSMHCSSLTIEMTCASLPRFFPKKHNKRHVRA